jgi:hypothetical protein
MVALGADPDKRRRLGAAAKVAVMEEFAIDRAVQPLIPLLSKAGAD